MHTLAAALDSPRSSTGGNPSALTLKVPECCRTPSATTMQFSAWQTPLVCHCDCPQEVHCTTPGIWLTLSSTLTHGALSHLWTGLTSSNGGSVHAAVEGAATCEEAGGGLRLGQIDGQRIREVLQEVAAVLQLGDAAHDKARLAHAAQ